MRVIVCRVDGEIRTPVCFEHETLAHKAAGCKSDEVIEQIGVVGKPKENLFRLLEVLFQINPELRAEFEDVLREVIVETSSPHFYAEMHDVNRFALPSGVPL